MRLWIHFVASLLLVIAFYPLYKWMTVFILVGGFLVDLDHPIWYYIKNKKFALKKTYDYCFDIEERGDVEEYKSAVMLFHTFDVLLIVTIIALFSNIFLMIFIGLVIHDLMDFFFSYKLFKGFAFKYLFKKSALKFCWKEIVRNIR